MAMKKGKSLCMFSAKGGVGKSVNILNLAGVFEHLEKKVLVIDFDLYSGSIATYVNKKFKKSVYDMAEDVLNNRFTEISDYVVNFDKYIDVLADIRSDKYFSSSVLSSNIVNHLLV